MSQTQPSPDADAPAPAPDAPEQTFRGGRARSPFVDAALWAKVPTIPSRGAFVRSALDAYLAAPDLPQGAQPRHQDTGRFQANEVQRKRVGVYIHDAQWQALTALPGTIVSHFEAALRRALEQR